MMKACTGVATSRTTSAPAARQLSEQEGPRIGRGGSERGEPGVDEGGGLVVQQPPAPLVVERLLVQLQHRRLCVAHLDHDVAELGGPQGRKALGVPRRVRLRRVEGVPAPEGLPDEPVGLVCPLLAWKVIRGDDDEGVSFKATDRAKVSVQLLGALSDRHLTWSRGSLLSGLTEAESLSLSLAEAGRAARAALESHREASLSPFDAIAETAETTARSLGVNVAAAYKAHLDTNAIGASLGGLALHDGDLPLRQLGLGSKRMLTTGLQQQALRAPHVTLIDEVETGLEPHRIARLIEHLKKGSS
jgi:hypothetical protein